jgi:hypothetical protein
MLQAMGNATFKARDACPISCGVGNCSSGASGCEDDPQGVFAMMGGCSVGMEMLPGGCDGDISFTSAGSLLRDVCPSSCGDCGSEAEAAPELDTSPHTVCFPGSFRTSEACADDPHGYFTVVGGCTAAVFELGCDYNVADGFRHELADGTLLRHICPLTCGGCEVDGFEFSHDAIISDRVVVSDHHFRVRGLRNQRTVIHGAKFSHLSSPCPAYNPLEEGLGCIGNYRQLGCESGQCNGGAILAMPSIPTEYQSESSWKGDVIVQISWTTFSHNSACVDATCTLVQSPSEVFCTPRVQSCAAGKGGAIFAAGVFLLVMNSEFEFNTASAGGGGGICLDSTRGNTGGKLSIFSSTFVYSDIVCKSVDVSVTSALIVGPDPRHHYALSMTGRGRDLTITDVTFQSGHATSNAAVTTAMAMASASRVREAQRQADYYGGDIVVPGLLSTAAIQRAKISDTTFEPFTNGESVIMSLLGSCYQHPCAPSNACEYVQYSLSCTACPPPTVGPDGILCTPCAAGTGPNGNGTQCERCVGNSASSIGTCQPCPAGTAASEDRYSCNDVSVSSDVTDASVALAVLRSTNLLPVATFHLQADDIDAVTNPGAARDKLTSSLRRDLASSLDIDTSLLKVLRIRPFSTTGRRALQAGTTNLAFDVKISGSPSDSVQHIENLKQQLLNPASALRTSSAAGRIDAAVTPWFSFVCPAGMIREPGASACTACADRSTFTDDGQTCKPCPTNQIPNIVGDGCICKDGYYDSIAGRLVCYAEGEDFEQSDLQNAGAVSENDRCQQCDQCVACMSGLAVVNPGFALSETARLTTLASPILSAPAAVFKCPLDGCPGQADPRNGNESQVELKHCIAGFTGGLCAVCDETGGFVKDGNTCTQCDTGSSITVLAPVLGGLLVVGVAYQMTAKWRKNRAASKPARASAGVVSFIGGLMVQVKILIGLLQITTQLPVTLTIRYPDLFSELLSAIDVVLLDIFDVFRIQCLSALSLHAKFIVIMLMPMAGIIVVQILRCISNHGATPEQVAKNAATAAYRSFFVIFLLYPLLSRTTFSIFRCQTLATGERWHEGDYSINCDSPAHTAIAVVDIFCILIYPVGIPITFLGLLWRDERSRHLKETVKEVASPSGAGDATAAVPAVANSSYEFLRQDYKPEFYYYEIVVLSEKLVLTGLLIFVDQGSIFQAFVGACVAFGFFAAQVKCEPFVNPIDNLLKAVAEAQLFLTLLGSIVLRTDLGKDALSEDSYGGILAAALFAAPSVELLHGFKRLFSWLCDKTDESPSAIPDVVGAGDLDGTGDQINAVGKFAPLPKRP